ncbi:MAG: type II secretion system F family protein [Myxococcales bacterium]|nr:type II secretion system F family protein [Myxococcales bacterium]
MATATAQQRSKAGAARRGGQAANAPAKKSFKLSFGSGVSTKDLVVFTRQFSTMIDAGLPLVQCLDILGKQSENPSFRAVLLDVKGHVESGASFSDSLRRHPKVFDDLFVNLVAAGEVAGILDTILQRLGAYIEKAAKLKRQVKGAMAYPIGVLVIASVVIAVLLSKVIPTFQNMFKELKAGALPGPTQFVIDISHGFRDNVGIILATLIAGSIGFTTALKYPAGRLAFDTIILKVPIIGDVLRKVIVARFTRTLGTLLGAGVPILDALDITAASAGNVVVKKGILYARTKVSEGKDLAGPLAESRVFPTMVIQMISVGEQTGAMDTMLQKIAEFYDEEVDVAVGSLTALIEPFMMVFLGVVVGGMIIAMYLPIFEIAGNIQ